MKIEWNKKYKTIAFYSVSAIIIAGALLMGLYYLFFSDKGDIFIMLENIINVMAPVFYGIIFAYLLNFIMKYIENKILKRIMPNNKNIKLQRVISLMATYLFAIILTGGFLWVVLPQIIDSVVSLTQKIPEYYNLYAPQVIEYFTEVFPDVSFLDFSSILNNFGSMLADFCKQIVPQSFSFLQDTTSVISNVIFGIAISVYLLLSKEKFIAQTKKVITAILPQKHHDKIFDILKSTNTNFGGFISGKSIDSIIMGVLYFITLAIFNVKYALLISVLMAVFNMIPFFGPIIGAIPSCVITLIDNPWHVILVLIVIFVMQLIEGNIIGPKLIGGNTGLSAFWIIFSILLFGGISGVFGMIIAVPVFSVLYDLIKKYIEDRLKKKDLPHETNDYSIEEKPIIF